MSLIRKKKTASLLITGLCVLAMSLAMTVSAHADADPNKVPDVDTSRSDTLTIQMIYHKTVDESVPVSGEKFTIYKVADLETKGGSAIYTPTSDFKSVDIDYDGLSKSDSAKAAKKMAALVESTGKAGTMATTDSEGNAKFTGLSHGIYLVIETSKTGKAKAYSNVDPFLVQVPGVERVDEENTWNYDVVSEVKFEVKKNKVKPCSVKLKVKKELKGKKLKDGMFRFNLKQTDKKGATLKNGTQLTAKNKKDGTVTFTVKFKKAGTYYFTITEINDGAKNMKYDSKKVKAVVKVIETEEGNLKVDEIQMDKDNTFNNRYKSTIPIIDTGDTTNMMMWGGILVIAAAGLMIVVYKRRKGEDNE